MIQVIIKKKTCVAKVLLQFKICFYMKIVLNISTDLVTNLLLFLVCPFLQIKNKNQVFSKLAVWQKEMFLFIVALYFKAMPDAIDLYKGIFLHVIHVCIIVL